MLGLSGPARCRGRRAWSPVGPAELVARREHDRIERHGKCKATRQAHAYSSDAAATAFLMGKTGEGAQRVRHRAGFVCRKQRELARHTERQNTPKRWLLGLASIGRAEQDRRVHSEPGIAHPGQKCASVGVKPYTSWMTITAGPVAPVSRTGFRLAQQRDVAPLEVGDVRVHFHARSLFFLTARCAQCRQSKVLVLHRYRLRAHRTCARPHRQALKGN